MPHDFDWQMCVREFNLGAKQTVAAKPTMLNEKDALLYLGQEVCKDGPDDEHLETEWRGGFLQEELDEMRAAFEKNDLPELADGIIDLIYVACGAANAMGVDLAPLFSAVHLANTKKLVGGVKDSTGKMQKPEGWTPPDIAAELAKQGWTPTVAV